MSGQPAPRRDPVDEGAAAGSNSDSITLGQLKAHTEEMKEKQKVHVAFDQHGADGRHICLIIVMTIRIH